MRKTLVVVAVLTLVAVLGATAVLASPTAEPAAAAPAMEVAQGAVAAPAQDVAAPAVSVQEPDEPETPEETPLYGRGTGRMWGDGTALDIVAGELGLTADELLAELQDGATIADLAAQAGTTIEAIVEALSEAHAEALQAAVDAGRISAEDAARRQERMEQMWTRRLESGRFFGGRGMGRQLNPDCPLYDGDGDSTFVPGQGMGGMRGGRGMGQGRGAGGNNG